MDKNKLLELNNIDYKVIKCCQICVHFENGNLNGMFGTCNKHNYKHLKHGEVRHLSVCKIGYCKQFEFNEFKLMILDKYIEFINEPIE